jgi:hypothetical protein
MDDVDAVQAQIARNMLQSGDWVTARLDGVAYLEKAPLPYWMIAAGYRVFGVHDWSARIPLALAVVLLCWVVYRFGKWAFDEESGTNAGVVLATCVGLFLFTRILIPDASLTLTIALAVWACLRLLEADEPNPLLWACILGASLGCGLLLKGLIAVVFPALIIGAYMLATRQLLLLSSWRRLRLPIAILIAAIIAVPWHVLATLRNPPYFNFSLHSGPGEYHGFFWFYFFNEHLLRFLNLRYPRDYNTVPRALFWALNLVWLFPWSAYVLGVARLSFRPTTRAGRVRLACLCWIGMILLFFTFSTTQEYYSMPIYPAMALLLGSAQTADKKNLRIGNRVLLGVFSLLAIALTAVLILAVRLPAKHSIADALTQNTDLYTLSLGHMFDLTLGAFAYLKMPLAIAAIAFGFGALALARSNGSARKALLSVAVTMIIFFQAARIALVRFDPTLGSYPLAMRLEQSPPGQLILNDAYYGFSSVFFYTNRSALLLNGRFNNLEYGSYAPGAANVFIDNAQFVSAWNSSERYYLLAHGQDLSALQRVLGSTPIFNLAENAGNYLLTNHAVK